MRFSTAGLGPGAYEAVLVDHRGVGVSRSPFWLYRRGAPTEVATSREVYRQGTPIRVTWSNAPGMRWDWLGIYRAGGAPPSTTCNAGSCGNGNYILYEYTHASIAGTTSFTARSGSWPLKPGRYEIRLLLDDGYRMVARSRPFTVIKR